MEGLKAIGEVETRYSNKNRSYRRFESNIGGKETRYSNGIGIVYARRRMQRDLFPRFVIGDPVKIFRRLKWKWVESILYLQRYRQRMREIADNCVNVKNV